MSLSIQDILFICEMQFSVPSEDNVGRSEESVDNVLCLVESLQPVSRDDDWTPGSPQQSPSVVTSGAVTAASSHHSSDGVLVPGFSTSMSRTVPRIATPTILCHKETARRTLRNTAGS